MDFLRAILGKNRSQEGKQEKIKITPDDTRQLLERFAPGWCEVSEEIERNQAIAKSIDRHKRKKAKRK